MPSSLVEHYRRWLAYENDSHNTIFSSFETIPLDRRTGPESQRALQVLGHIVFARRLWLSRLGAIAAPVGPLFPTDTNLAQLRAEWIDTHTHWESFLADADDALLNRSLEYQSLDGARFRSRIDDILAQLYGHSWYHRGQIAMLIKAAGGQPPITDLIYWSREAIADPPSN